MKKNLWLLGILCGVLFLTWLITEQHIFSSTPVIETEFAQSIKSAKRILLPNAELAEVEGVWRLRDGEIARADYLQELHRSLEQIKVSKTITLDAGKTTVEYFSAPVTIKLDDHEYIIGDLSATGESFYFTAKGSQGIYLVDLNEMGSVAVADSQNLLQREKYHRLRDLIQVSENGWRERRLAALTQFGSFRSWRSGEYSLIAAELKAKPWGELLVQALQAGIASLEVQGNVLKERPAKHASVGDWVFTLEDGSEASWEFFEHPTLELVYVWIPRLKKAYPLGQTSSDFLKDFIPRLIDRPFPLTLHPTPLSEAQLSEGKDQWKVSVNARDEKTFSPASIDVTAGETLLHFFRSQQNFDSLTLLAPKDCQRMLVGMRFGFKTPDMSWGILPVPGALVFLECSTSIALSWGLDRDSQMDIKTLRKLP